MNGASGGGGGGSSGLVSKLFFPAFADSGSNETFRAPPDDDDDDDDDGTPELTAAATTPTTTEDGDDGFSLCTTSAIANGKSGALLLERGRSSPSSPPRMTRWNSSTGAIVEAETPELPTTTTTNGTLFRSRRLDDAADETAFEDVAEEEPSSKDDTEHGGDSTSSTAAEVLMEGAEESLSLVPQESSPATWKEDNTVGLTLSTLTSNTLHKSQEDAEETNSLESNMGSADGDRRLRLEDVVAMEALMEEGEEPESDRDDDEDDNEDPVLHDYSSDTAVNDENTAPNGAPPATTSQPAGSVRKVFSTSLLTGSNSWDTFSQRISDQDPALPTPRNSIHADVAALVMPTLEDSEKGEVRPLRVESDAANDTNQFRLEAREEKTRPDDSSGEGSATSDEKETLTTSMGVVSAAFRRIGTGVGTLGSSIGISTTKSHDRPKSPSETRSGDMRPPTTPRTPSSFSGGSSLPQTRLETAKGEGGTPNRHRQRGSSNELPSPSTLQYRGSTFATENSLSREFGSTTAKHFSSNSPRHALSPGAGTSRFGNTGAFDFREELGERVAAIATPLRRARACFTYEDQFDYVPEEQYTARDNVWASKERAFKSPKQRLHAKSWDGQEPLAAPVHRARSRSIEKLGVSPHRRSRRSDHALLLVPPKSCDAPLEKVANVDFSTTPARDAMSLQSPQRIEIEREDALDILSCLVERTVAFEEQGEEGGLTPAKADNDPAEEEKEMSLEASEEILNGSPTSLHSPEGRQINNATEVTQGVGPTPLTSHRSANLAGVGDALDELRRISRLHEQFILERGKHNGDSASDEWIGGTDHDERSRVLDELARSHTYAVEMKRAAKSASTWLRAIGRPRLLSPSERKEEDDDSGNESIDQVESGCVTSMEAVSMKALVHDMELKLQEKDEQMQKIDKELCICRAEIGRLRSAARSEGRFISPNRSILDDDDEDETASEISHHNDPSRQKLENDLGDVTPIPGSANTSYREELTDLVALEEARKEILMLKVSLAEANRTIVELRDGDKRADSKIYAEEKVDASVSESKLLTDVNISTMGVVNLSVASNNGDGQQQVLLADASLADALTKYVDAARASDKAEIESLRSRLEREQVDDEKMINVRMLDGENFVTEWDDLTPPLPPPPDHGLRSPIVQALVSQWTNDMVMQESLLNWMEDVLSGADPATVPKLKISSLDHQVKDGFAMHIIPLLLRRADVHVEVKSRAHRRTSYDMAVSVTKTVVREPEVSREVPETDGVDTSFSSAASQPSPNRKQMMAFQASRGGNPVMEDESMDGDHAETLKRPAAVSEAGVSISSSSATFLTSNRNGGAVLNGMLSQHYKESRHHSTSPTGMSLSDRRSSQQPRSHHGGQPPILSMSTSDDASIGSSVTGSVTKKVNDGQNSGLMSAIGGAFGGLLSRRKPATDPLATSNETHDQGGTHKQRLRSTMGRKNGSGRYVQDLPTIPSSPAEDDSGGAFTPDDVLSETGQDEPYHRVVSAPPGRLGVTFVQYRGHAMISAVASDSPLSGWIFEHDILIAIDEVPVSGLRVREIVRLLTVRRDSPRALRLISSHAMSELTAAHGDLD